MARGLHWRQYHLAICQEQLYEQLYVSTDIASYLTSILFVVQNRRTPILSEVTMHPAQRLHFQGFLGGPVVGNPPANAGDTGTIPDLGGFPRVTWQLSPCGTTAETICCNYWSSQASLVVQLVKNPAAMQETPVRSLGREDPLEKGKATHSSVLA